jgi:hypothetical protein
MYSLRSLFGQRRSTCQGHQLVSEELGPLMLNVVTDFSPKARSTPSFLRCGILDFSQHMALDPDTFGKEGKLMGEGIR